MPGLPRAGVQLVADDAAAFQSALQNATEAVTRFGQTAERAGGGVSSFGQVAIGALRQVGTIAVDAAVQGAKAIGKFVGDSISAAADYEQGMNRFAAVTGEAIADAGMELSDFSALFLKLGAETQFSAAQAQEAAVALAKGGIDPLTIASGALADTLTLAAAGELELGTAAEITAKQLGVWASAGVTSAEVANLLAQAANASTVDVDELALGLANVGGIAKVAGLSFGETVQAMALLAPGFSSAADAGTSFKTFLTRLQPTTSTAAGAMLNLGLLTEQGTSKFYDAQGSFIGMGNAAQLLQDSLAGLSEAQKVTALQAIFGQDAFRAAALIAEQGAAGYDKMGAAMTGAGTAAEQAAARNQGFAFALESMKGSVETLQIVLGTALLPVLTQLINNLLIPGINAAMSFAQGILSAADPMAALVISINSVLPGFASFVTFMQGVIVAAQPLIDLIGANLVPILGAVATVLGAGLLVALGGVVAGFVAVAAPVAAAVAALALLYANIGPIQDALQKFGNTEWGQALQRGAAVAGEYFAGPFVSQVSGGVSAVQSSLNTLAASTWGQDLQRGAQVAGNYFAGPFASELAGGVDVVAGKLQALGASTWWQALSQGAQTVTNLFVSAMTTIATTVASSLQQVTSFAQSHASELQAIFSGAWNAIVGLVTGGTQVLIGIVTAAMQALTGDWTGAWNTIKSTTSTLVTGIVSVIQSTLETIPDVVSTIFDAAVSVISGFVGQFSEAGAALIEGVADGIRNGASAVIDAAVGAATDAINAVKEALSMGSPSRVAAEEIGTPFVMGIVEGIEESADLLEDMARQLSEQLVDDMAAVGEAAAEAFKDMFAAGLAGTAGIARQKTKNLRDVGKLDDGGKGIDAVKGEQAALKSKRDALLDKQSDAIAAMVEKRKSIDDTAADKRKAINDRAADAEVTRQDQIADIKRKSDAEEEERKRKIAAIMRGGGTDEDKQARINDLNATYADQEIERQDRIDEIKTASDKAEEARKTALGDLEAERKTALADLEDKYRAQQIVFRDQLAKMDADELVLKNKLLAAEQLRATLLERQAAVRKELADAEAFAATFTDPELGAKYFKEESARIMELADLRRDYLAATTNEEKAAITQQMRQLEEAQRAEKALFTATAAEQSKTFDDTAEALQTVLDKLRYEAKRDLGISKLDIGKENQDSAYAEYLADLEAIKKIEALLTTVNTPIRPAAAPGQLAQTGIGSTSSTRNWNFNYTTQQSMGSVLQDIDIAQVLSGY